MSGICPICGYNLEADAIVERDGWRIDPRGEVLFEGRTVTTRRSWTAILLTLAREGGRRVTAEVLLSRTSSSERNNTMSSAIRQMRRAVEAQGLPWPVVSYRRGGYAWRAVRHG